MPRANCSQKTKQTNNNKQPHKKIELDIVMVASKLLIPVIIGGVLK